MTLCVHLLQPRDDASVQELREHLDPRVELTAGPEQPVPANCDILIAGRPRREDLVTSPTLHTLIIPWAGLPESTRDLARELGVAVHNLHHNANPVAEMAIGLMIAAAKFIVPADRALRRHDWTPRYRPNPAILLDGRTALVLGYGAIGRRIACACRGLGLHVIGIRRRVSGVADEYAAEIYAPEALHRLLPRADILFVCVPHTAETTGLVGANELALLPADSVLVNVGRGPVVDETSLYHGLCEGRPCAAGLDVWYNYPDDESSRKETPPSAYPFHELDNVVMSPHRAGGAKDIETRRMAHLAALLNAAVKGEEIPNRVDLDAGY